MNDKTIDLMQKLADKFGTTVNNLMTVLIRQARIDAITYSIIVVLVAIGGMFLYKLHIRLSKPIPDDKWDENEYDKNVPIAVLMTLAGTTFFIFIIVSIFMIIPDIINDLCNPEFAALKYIIDTIK